MTGPTNNPESYYIYDGITEALNDRGYNENYNALNVLPQDNENISFNLYLTSTLATTTLANNASLNNMTVIVTSATGITTGKTINIRQEDRFFQSLITNVSGTTITLASPLDYAFTSGATVRVGDWNLNQNGSVTPVTFKLQPPSNAKFHITAISITITDDSAMDDTKFGGITALTKGIIARRAGGSIANLFFITNNRGFYQYGYETQYNDRAGGTGSYGFLARKKIKEINGNAIALNGFTNDEVQVIISSDLTTLTEFTIQVHGHIIDN